MRLIHIIIFLFPVTVFSQEVFDSSIVRATAVFLFDSDVDTLSESQLTKIDSLYGLYGHYPNVFFEIEGHTDDVGSYVYNEALSSRRKGSLEARLILQGASDENIKSRHFGELKPFIPNNDDKAKSKNRRAELRVIIIKRMTQLTGKVVDIETNEGIPSEIELRSKDFTTKVNTSIDGTFSVFAPFREVVGLEIFADNYFFKSKMLKVTPEALRQKTEISLPRIEIGKAFIMEKLFFEGNRSVLLPNSEKELPRILKLMKRNEETCIEIAGNINLPNQDSTEIGDIHYQLSVARSLEVFDYLVSQGIAQERLLAKGYGNWRMVYPKAKTESKMSKNRRVEIGIMHCAETRRNVNDSIPNQAFFKTATNLLKRI